MSSSKTVGEYKARAIIKHGRSNFDYSLWPESITSAQTFATSICPKHGEFTQRITKHVIDGRGCRKCGRVTFSEKLKHDGSFYIKRANKVFGGKYEYIGVPSGKVASSFIITVRCQTHGDFEQPIGRIHVNGCFHCAQESKRLGRNTLITMCKHIHGSKYDYSLWSDDIAVRDWVETVCPEHGVWRHQVRKHLEGSGCHKCANVGFKQHELGYLYFLRSDEGLIKVGISNNYKFRIDNLRKRTPFSFGILAVFLHRKGSQVSETEKLIHKYNKSAGLSGFDGATEWRHINDFDVLNLPELFGFTRIL